MQYKTVLGSEQFSMCSEKCTYLDSGTFAGAAAVRNIHSAVCRVHCAEEIAVETG